MKNLIQETGKTVRKVWAIKIWRVILALVLVAGLASVVYFPAKQVLADSKSNSADVIFTKWVTTAGSAGQIEFDQQVMLNMEGVASGDSGPGLFKGEVLQYNNPSAPISNIEAVYHVNGNTMHVFVTQDNNARTAVVTGSVTDGWMIGAKVTGSYQVITPSGIINAKNGAGGDFCYQGTLHIRGH
jgi:hypothetical protein